MGCLQSYIKINECCLGGDRMTLKPVLLGTIYACFNWIMHFNGGKNWLPLPVFIRPVAIKCYNLLYNLQSLNDTVKCL